jgi:hypothetical protein
MHPFSEGDTRATFQNLITRTIAEIESLDNEYVLKASPTELEEYFVSKVLIQPLILHREAWCIEDQRVTRVDVSRDYRRGFPGPGTYVTGTTIVIAIPYEGDQMLWRLRPSIFGISGHIEIDVRKDTIAFSVRFPDDAVQPDRLRGEIDRNVHALEETIRHLKEEVDTHNQSAPNTIRQAIKQKRERAQSATTAIASLGIPMKRSTNPSFAIPTKRRVASINRPPVLQAHYEAEPFLDQQEYDHILVILKSMALVIERNPTSFASLDEEAIRDHFLLQLNGHYEGNATGETFNASGKTDILIRSGNKNVFIAECKFWRGPKSFDEAIDQLLSYLTWRDSKCALLIFNTTKDTTAVGQKMHEVMQARKEHKKTLTQLTDADPRYVLVKDNEPGREIIITTQVYDIPK